MSEGYQDDHPITPSSGRPHSQAGEAPSPDTPNGDGVPSASPKGSPTSGEGPLPASTGQLPGSGFLASPGISLPTGGGPPPYATGGGQSIRPLSGWPWSAEDDAVLRRRWHEKGGASTIGRELGRTRNAVIGRANRLGLAVPRPLTEERRKAGAEAAAERRRQVKRAWAARRQAQGKPRPADDHPWRGHDVEAVRQAVVRQPSLTHPGASPGASPKRDGTLGPDACELVDFTPYTCRWPLGELHDPVRWFCGVPEADMTAGVAYCPRHMAICYAAPRERVR